MAQGRGKDTRQMSEAVVEDPEEMRAVDRIRELRDDGRSFRGICEALAEEG